jgi:hypothetical protein
MGKVFVKLVERESAQKRKSFIYAKNSISKEIRREKNIESGKSIGTNGKSGFRFLVSQHKPGYLNTGFSERVENPWFENAKDLPIEWQNLKIDTKQEISRQEYFEIKLGLRPGTLHSNSKRLFDKKDTLSWIQQWYRDFIDTTVLDLNEPIDELTYWLLLQSSNDKCANSYKDITPFSRIYISQVNEDEERVAKKNEIIEQAVYDLVTFKNEHSESEIIKLAVILKVVKGEVSIKKIKQSLSDFISLKTPKQFENIKDFGKLYANLQDAKGKDIFEAKYLLQECINNRVISDYKGKYIWSSKKGTNLELIGKTYNEVLTTLLDIDWRHYREELELELKAKLDDNRLMAF